MNKVQYYCWICDFHTNDSMVRGYHSSNYEHVSKRIILQAELAPEMMEIGQSTRYVAPSGNEFSWKIEISDEEKFVLFDQTLANRERLLRENSG